MPLRADSAEHIAEEARDAFDLTEERKFRSEGDRPMYFFSFLKGLRTVLLDARARGLAVMHIRYVYLFSEDGRVAPGNYSPGAPTEPDMQVSSIRLFESRIRCATINTVHDSPGH